MVEEVELRSCSVEALQINQNFIVREVGSLPSSHTLMTVPYVVVLIFMKRLWQKEWSLVAMVDLL